MFEITFTSAFRVCVRIHNFRSRLPVICRISADKHFASLFRLNPYTITRSSSRMANVPVVTFNNGLKCPQFGLGTWKSKPGEVSEAVFQAIEIGYRHIDCAFIYQNEKEVGQGIEKALQKGICKREDLFITTKLWNTFHKDELVVPSLKQSLDNLKLTYVDLYLIHWPQAYKEGDELFPVDANNKTAYSTTSYLETWKAMECCVKQGLAKSIGVSNVYRYSKPPCCLQEGGELFPLEANDKKAYSTTSYLETWKDMERCVEQGLTKSIEVSNVYRYSKPPCCLQEGGELFPVYADNKTAYSTTSYLETWKAMERCVEQGLTKSIEVSNVYRYSKPPCCLQEGGELFPVDANNKTAYSTTSYLETWKAMERCVEQGLTKSIEVSNVYRYSKPPCCLQEGGELFPVDANNKTAYSTTSYLETWKAMERCVEQGLTKSIGVSNFNSKQLAEVLETATIKPVTNQVECHPFLVQKKLKAYLDSVGIMLTAYSPLGSPDRPWAKPDEQPLLANEKLNQIAQKYNKSAAQIALRWQIEKGNIVIPKSVTKSRIESNIQIFDFSLKPEDIEAIDSLDCNARMVGLEALKDHPDYPFNEEF